MTSAYVGISASHEKMNSFNHVYDKESPARRKTGKMLSVRIQFLDDSLGDFQLQFKALGKVLFEQVCNMLNLLEVDYFGLEYPDAYGVMYWLDLEKPICQQNSLCLVNPIMYFCVKFYTPDPAQLEEEFTRYLFSLQIKHDLAQGTLVCNDNTAALIASYIVQAECGDFDPEDYPDHTYLSSFRFVRHQDFGFEKKIMENHKKHVGQTPSEADLNLLETSRKCELYGIKMTPAKDQEGVPINLAVAHMGILVFQNMTKINTFSWAKIRKLSFKRKKFLIKLHPERYAHYKDMVEFYFERRNVCKNFWKKCLENHGFFRCTEVHKIPRQKTRIFSNGSSFRYSGRTQKQIMEYVRKNFVKRHPFQRCRCGLCEQIPTRRECIIQTRGFDGHCLNIDVLEASYCEFVDLNCPFSDEEPSHESTSLRLKKTCYQDIGLVGTSVSSHPLLPVSGNVVSSKQAHISQSTSFYFKNEGFESVVPNGVVHRDVDIPTNQTGLLTSAFSQDLKKCSQSHNHLASSPRHVQCEVSTSRSLHLSQNSSVSRLGNCKENSTNVCLYEDKQKMSKNMLELEIGKHNQICWNCGIRNSQQQFHRKGRVGKSSDLESSYCSVYLKDQKLSPPLTDTVETRHCLQTDIEKYVTHSAQRNVLFKAQQSIESDLVDTSKYSITLSSGMHKVPLNKDSLQSEEISASRELDHYVNSNTHFTEGTVDLEGTLPTREAVSHGDIETSLHPHNVLQVLPVKQADYLENSTFSSRSIANKRVLPLLPPEVLNEMTIKSGVKGSGSQLKQQKYSDTFVDQFVQDNHLKLSEVKSNFPVESKPQDVQKNFEFVENTTSHISYETSNKQCIILPEKFDTDVKGFTTNSCELPEFYIAEKKLDLRTPHSIEDQVQADFFINEHPPRNTAYEVILSDSSSSSSGEGHPGSLSSEELHRLSDAQLPELLVLSDEDYCLEDLEEQYVEPFSWESHYYTNDIVKQGCTQNYVKQFFDNYSSDEGSSSLNGDTICDGNSLHDSMEALENISNKTETFSDDDNSAPVSDDNLFSSNS